MRFFLLPLLSFWLNYNPLTSALLVSKKYWEKFTTDFVTLVNQVDKIQTVEILQTSFFILPGVFSPVYSSDTAWFASQVIPLVRGKSFLEIGSGSGVIACLAALHGASKVVATDISPKAVENTNLNAKALSLNIPTLLGDVFEPLDSDALFDLIFWNHPFNYSEELSNDPLTNAVFDPYYLSLRKFFQKGKRHLTQRGRLLLGSSNIARIHKVKQIAHEERYICSVSSQTEVPIYKARKTMMELRVYSFQSL